MFSQKVNPSKFIQQYTRSIYAAFLHTSTYVQPAINFWAVALSMWPSGGYSLYYRVFALPHALQAPMLFGEDTPTLKFVEISATRIANQLTVIEHEVFQRITPLWVELYALAGNLVTHTYVYCLEATPSTKTACSTCTSYCLLRTVYCSELVGQKWTKRNKRDFAPGICCFIERFNLVRTMVLYDNPPSMYCAYARYT